MVFVKREHVQVQRRINFNIYKYMHACTKHNNTCALTRAHRALKFVHKKKKKEKEAAYGSLSRGILISICEIHYGFLQ